MRLTSVIAAFLASARASGSPDVETSLVDSLVDGETNVYKRDADVTPHLGELAERDNIDLSQMYIHSEIKRNNGEHVTIWVLNSYNKNDNVDIGDDSDMVITKCQSMNNAAYTGDAGPGAPFTGVPPPSSPGTQTAEAAGSSQVQFDKNINPATWREFGCGDVGNLIRISRERLKRA